MRGLSLKLAGFLSALGFLVLLLPFAFLPLNTPWASFHFTSGDLGAVRVSLVYSGLALLLILVFGTPLAYILARRRFRFNVLVEILVLLPLLTPPLAMGILLASLYGPYGFLGEPLSRLGLLLTNTPQAFVLAQVYGAAPYYLLGARAAFEGVPRELEGVALTLGKTPLEAFFRVTLPLARLGLASALATAWVRALGEFGIVLIIAYYPQGIPVRLWVNLQDVGLSAVYPLLWLFFAIALPLPLLLGALSRRGR